MSDQNMCEGPGNRMRPPLTCDVYASSAHLLASQMKRHVEPLLPQRLNLARPQPQGQSHLDDSENFAPRCNILCSKVLLPQVVHLCDLDPDALLNLVGY